MPAGGKIGNDNIPADAFTYLHHSDLAYVFGPDQAYTNGGTITDIKEPESEVGGNNRNPTWDWNTDCSTIAFPVSLTITTN
ncbi:hypothetical protein NT017_00050 [Prolixibacter sp. NT017]|nr:hypothetical protein NT017_00050 [Prolixibacter sp. NT017]